MFEKILIANRGEIACRIMETAQKMGISCVGVYSDADATSKHVEMADVAVHIGGSTPTESYLCGDVIIQAAIDLGAQAIHPGYGFLSENPDFVDDVLSAGLIFIGPSAEAIRAMGLKAAAKALMVEAGVPVVPGYHGSDQSDDLLADEANKIGYPVLIKAVAGGGGKGMRFVEEAGAFQSALESARSEAQSAFSNSDVLVEKFVRKPRHIEVQIFGDGDDVVYLFERDCSLQRRHQKVVEEAPAPGMTTEMRAVMGQAAVKAAKFVNYVGAGTVEFIVDGSDDFAIDSFYFMEMNTRLQVEHAVTEAITGVDLVEWQLRVAAGESLPVQQDNLSITGHAFEARLYAEDVVAGFLPATGTLTHLAFPEDIRVESGVRAGDKISPFYDPMIAKVVSHGPTRNIALKRLAKALALTEVAGTTTNLEFLGALVNHTGFGLGEFDTGLIQRDIDKLIEPLAVTAGHAVAAAMKISGLNEPKFIVGFHMWQPLCQSVSLARSGLLVDASVEVVSPDRQHWNIDGVDVVAERFNGKWWIDGQKAPHVTITDSVVTVFDKYGIRFDVIDALDVVTEAVEDGDFIEAPMPGLIKSMFVSLGDKVSKGDRLAILEAMKMEHSLSASRNGTVVEVLANSGDQVIAGAALVRLEDET